MSLSVTREIQAIIDMNLTAFNVNLSKLLVSQRDSIAELMQIRDRLKAEVAEVTKQRDQAVRLFGTLTGGVPAEEPKFSIKCGSATPAAEQTAEEEEESGGDKGIDIEIRVTSSKPIPPELKAMLDDLTEMLSSAARK